MVQSSVLSYIDIFYILSIILILHSFHPFDQGKKKINPDECINDYTKRRYQNDNGVL
jgi:hypothetical protein